MNRKLVIVSFILNIFLGAFMFVFGEADDSPGAQLLGLVTALVGISGLVLVALKRQVSN